MTKMFVFDRPNDKLFEYEAPIQHTYTTYPGYNEFWVSHLVGSDKYHGLHTNTNNSAANKENL